MPIELRFHDYTDDYEVTRLVWNETEATAAQAAGVDGGRLSVVKQWTLVSPGYAGQELIALGPSSYSTYARVYAYVSTVNVIGTLVDITNAPLAATATSGVTLYVWTRLKTLRGFGLTNPRVEWSLRLRAAGTASWGV